MERLKRITELAKKKGPRIEPTNIALAYVLNQAFPTCAVIGPQEPEEAVASIRAADLQLSEEERLWINLQK